MIEQASLVIGEGNWAVKSDSLLGYKINGGKYYPREMSVVRATTGTRINEDGLVELVPYNLVQYSEDFSNVTWTKAFGSLSSNVIASPSGTLTADKFIENTTNVEHYLEQSFTSIASTTYTFSLYAKAAERSRIVIQLLSVSSPFENVYVEANLISGTLVVQQGYNGATFVGATIEELPNGWYRITASGSIGAKTNMRMRIYTANNSGQITYLGDGTSGLYLWGAQLVEGSSALDYLPTTDRLDVARIDYSSGSGALLVEPQRTNLLTYSSSFDNAAWTKLLSSVTANAAISPSGNTDAYKLVESTGNGAHRCGRTSGSVNGTFSFYAKSGERTKIAILSTIIDVGFDLSNGTLIDLGSGTTNATITSVGNGWYRCSLYQATGISGVYFALLNSSGNFSYTGDGTSGAYFWGAQIENASYPTSYIPTQSATVTRNADVISKTGIADLIGQTEGTVYIDTYIDNISAQTNDPVLIYLKGTSVESYIEIFDNGLVVALHYNGTTQCSIQTSSGFLTNGRHKFAFGYKANDFVFYIDGVLIGTDTSGSVGAQSELGLQYYNSAVSGRQNVNAAALWKTRLTNAQLATLTTI